MCPCPIVFFFFVFLYTLYTIHIHNIIFIVAGKPARVDVEKTVFFLWLYEFIAIDLQKQQLERERERERDDKKLAKTYRKEIIQVDNLMSVKWSITLGPAVALKLRSG